MSLSSDAIVNRLMHGDSYEPNKRLQNISTAMSWIQQELEGLKQSDRTLMNLFKQLESDMSEVKSDPRGSQRQCPVSPMNGLTWKNDKSRTDTVPIDGTLYSVPENKSTSSLDFPPSLTRINLQSNTAASIFRQMEEEDEELGVEDSDSDSDSLDDFADTLGGDDEEEEAETKVESQPVSRTLYHQSAPHLRERDYDSVSAGSRGSQSSGLATVGILTHPSSESPRLQRPSSKTTITRNLSNDSGVQFCTDTETNGTSTTTSRTGLAGDETKSDPKAFANEVFAMLNF